MADFVDDEAIEASSSDENEEEEEYSSRAKKAKKSREVIDSSEEEEDDDDDIEEMKDLINDEEEDDQSSDDEAGKRSHDGSSSLSEDDIELIKENTGVRLPKKKKFKRIRTTLDDDSEEEADEGKKIENELFGNNLLDSDDEAPARQDVDLAVDDEESESDDNFIVDDNDQPIYKKAKKKGSKYTDSAMQQAQEVFGVDFDFDDLDEDDGYDEDGYEDYDEEEEGGEARPRRKKAGRKSIYEIYEPAELARCHMTDSDQKIRTKDEPERFQLRQTPVTSADDDELEKEAKWIFQTAFESPTISRQEVRGTVKATEPEIRYALSCIRNEKLEVPFIAAYRREYVPFISSSFDDTKDLWTIYRFDEQWCRLQAGKKSITGLYHDMRAYIEGMPHDSRIRPITDLDLQRVNNVSNFYELEDCRLHFKLYYSSLVAEMKIKSLEEKIAKRKQNNKEKNLDNPDTENGIDNEHEEIEQIEDKTDESDEEKLLKRLSKMKISSSRDFYQKCRQDNIGALVHKFGLTPEQLAENFDEDYQKHPVASSYQRPLDEAEAFVNPEGRFKTRESVLKAATHMFSREVSCDPLIRQFVRKYYFANSVMTVKPTIQGMKEIDENHPCYSVKFLKKKPVKTLEGEQILHILNAERDKHLEVKFSIEATPDDAASLSPFHESLRSLYYSDFSSIITKEWNDQRDEAIMAAVDKYLLPNIEKQLREQLVMEAQDKIMKTICAKLNNWLNIAPYSPATTFDDYEDFELRNGLRICGFTFDPDGEAPCFAAIIDGEGELLDQLRLPFFNIRKRRDRMNATERENHAKDIQRFKQFIINRKPHGLALAAETIQTKYICQELAQILDELREHDGLPLIPIEIVDNELSNVIINLKRSSDEFPEFPHLLLQAISNARKLNDPLSEYAKLCNSDDDITCIRFHSLQDDLPKEEFLARLHHEFVTRTNAVGVDPNRCIAHPHTSDLMQFVAGLGPRKSAALLRAIKKSSSNGLLLSRQQLVREMNMTSIIFINCAGFIKVDTDHFEQEYPDEHTTPLDSTRIHPQSYGLAKKIASDALDYEEGASDEATANAIEEILEAPEKLDDLDLGAFAKELDEVQNQGKKGFTLQSIREEFQCRYKDHRESYKAPSQEEIFAMLTKETPYTFYFGKLVTCQVVAIPRRKPVASQLDMANPVKIDETNLWRCPFCMRSDFQDLGVVWNHFDTDDCPGYALGVRCRLDNGLFGFVPTKMISDSEIADPSQRVVIGQTIHARVTKIDTEKFSCDLTCRSSDLIDKDGRYKPRKDPDYYDEDAENAMKLEIEAKTKRANRRPYCKRVIIHPAFENIDYKACEKKLALMEQGTAIIRPSSQGPDFLTVSWKITDGINQHVSIREEGKDNPFSLGHQLFIDNETYEDLDEIIARYIQPMAAYARELQNYKYYVKLPEDTDEVKHMQDVLINEKNRAPSTFPYRFCPSRKFPGKFLFGYIPKDKPIIEYLTVAQKGYRFRKLYHKNLAQLIKWFKLNWNKIQQQQQQVYQTPGMAMSNPLSSLRQTFPMSQ